MSKSPVVSFLKVSNNLNCLPQELYHFYLFKYLDLEDIMELRLVSKHLYSVVTAYDIYVNELSILNPLNYDKCAKDNWFATTKSTRLKNLFDFTKMGILQSPSMVFTNLKYLRVQSIDETYNLDVVNQFDKLEVLVISSHSSASSSQMTINLPSLKALSIEQFSITNRLTINTPNLHDLSINNKDMHKLDYLIKFIHPDSITYLRLYSYEDEVRKFTSLKCLEMCNFKLEYLGLPGLDLLLENKNLRKFKMSNCKKESLSYHLNQLFEIKKGFKNDVEIVLDGVRIDDINMVDEYERVGRLEFQLNHYDKLEDDLDFFSIIPYKKLISLLPGALPADLFKKYTNIRCLSIFSFTEDDDKNRLINFMKCCHNLSVLTTSNSSLGQQFYDQLSTFSLLSLDINMEKMKLDFGFMMKMRYLHSLFTDQDVLIDENLNLNNLKFLKKLSFYVNDQLFAIRKEFTDCYSVLEAKNLGLPSKVYLKFNEIIKWSKYLRDKKHL